MSARAAARLAMWAFEQVYRYQAGKADWFAAGLPREGAEADVPRVADIARRDVPTCGIVDRVGDVRNRLQERNWDVCVVNAERVVLGLVRASALGVDPATPVEEVMESSPVTFRPHVRAGEMPEYVKKRGIARALVTTSDGVLIGLLCRADLDRDTT